jgi:NADH-quinone oxidoreductase subunit E
MSVLSEHVLEEIRELPAKYPQHRSAVMPALDLAQEEVGYLTPEAMSEVAAALQLDPGYVEGVATFYTLFHLQPVGKHRFYVCTNLSCTLRGANEIVEHLKGAIGVHEPEEVSKDGFFSYEEVECLGACEYAPVMRLDHRYEKDLTNQKIDSLIALRRSARVESPHPAAPAAQPTSPHGGEVKPHPPTSSPPKARAPRKKKSG